ncbi:aldehyde dehydrogenase family protein [Salsuginibacillus kocurii]|uniref:aldehyde dehydrogenase family protein n=1 Tax=Salsuginibacillus kocurii TaxID=427078 RepID=UPI00036AB606|nr:aldehyde dehydrogenase family protein [Salsuginibacillus kocurii]
MCPEAFHPANELRIGHYSETAPDEVSHLYDYGWAAFENWHTLPLQKRLTYLRLLRETIVESQDEIASIISKSTGKPEVDALVTEVFAVVDAIKHIEKEAPSILNNEKVKTPLQFQGKTSYINRKPRGTILVISPWNYPFQLGMISTLEAIAMGNTVILKPSEMTPMVGELLKRLSGIFPDHVLQVVIGGKELGEALVEEGPDYIHFTGSVEVGKVIQMAAAKQLIPTTLELGGKDAMIVRNDANITRAAKAAVWGAFSNSGQICLSVERVYVHEQAYPGFITEVRREVAKLKQDLSSEADMGTMTTKAQKQVVAHQLRDALNKNATLEYGESPDHWNENDSFISPLVLTNVTHDMAIMQEETFGPVMPIHTFENDQEAVDLANDTDYGLGGSIFTSDLERANEMIAKLETGNVMINDVIKSVANPHLPYGGVKQSGIGKSRGRTGMQAFCIETSVMSDAGKADTEFNYFPNTGKYHLLKQMISAYWGPKKDYKKLVSTFLELNKRTK